MKQDQAITGTPIPLAAFLLISLLIGLGACSRTPAPPPPPPPPSAHEKLETRLQTAGKVLIEAEYSRPEEAVGLSLRLPAADLKNHALYLKRKRGDDFLYISHDAQLESAGIKSPNLPQTVVSELELLLTRDAQVLFLDRQLVLEKLSDWTLYWVADQASKPSVTETIYPAREIQDGFMRNMMTDENAPWIVSQGEWTMKQHGGGLPQNEAQMASYNFQRAVNPFSVTGQGLLSYGRDDWLQTHAEARFYFGVPWEEGAVDTQTLPTAMTLMIAMGASDGELVAFGWSSRDHGFVLECRDADGKWSNLSKIDGPRPPISNWVRIGLQIRDGHIAEGYVDGAKVTEVELGRRIQGPFHIRGGIDPVEFDDVRAWTLPKVEALGEPIFVQSRNFAGKKLKSRSDPTQFSEWAQSSDTFLQLIERHDDYKKALIINRIPLMGDFRYESVPEDPELGELPFGLYEIVIYSNPDQDRIDLDKLTEHYRLPLIRDEEGWHAASEALKQWRFSAPQFTLRLRRLHEEGNHVSVQIDDNYVPLVRDVSGPIHLAIARLLPLSSPALFPAPQHHMIYTANLHNEFFEQAPTEWNWIEGGFRMDARWACQDRWNFMACGGVGVPMMVSKTSYHGDQQHEYYLSLRPMFPSDAGDSSFVYNKKKHRKYLHGNGGWYVRRDLNFSFCMDGRNPLSGYAVVFGGADNTETRLLRQGKIVARTKAFKLPTDHKVGAVHWKWWDFVVRKRGGYITVRMNKRPIFDYEDPEPLTGGHIAYWTVRGGFTVSRITSAAEGLTRHPQVLYVPEDTAPPIWQPLQRDAVTVSRQDGRAHTLVTANVGAGFFAVRHSPPQPVDLKETPVLELPFELSSETKVNLHLQVDHKTYLLEIAAPLSDTKALLGNEFEPRRGDYQGPVNLRMFRELEQFRIPTISEDAMRTQRLLGTAIGGDLIRVNLYDLLEDRGHYGKFKLYSVTVGNTSNADYLLAGNGGNHAGASYALGTPKFTPAEK